MLLYPRRFPLDYIQSYVWWKPLSGELAAGLPPCTRLGHREEPSSPTILVHHSKPTDARRLGVHTAKGELHHSAPHPSQM